MLFVSVTALLLYDLLGRFANLFALVLALSFSILVYWGAYRIIVALWSWANDTQGSL